MASVIQPGWLLLGVCSVILLILGWYWLQRSAGDVDYIVPLVTPVYAAAPLWPPQPLYTISPQPMMPSATFTPTSHVSERAAFIIEKPTCYDSPTQQLLCIGRVYNPLDVPIENIMLDIRLSSAHYGTVAKTALSEQRVLLPDSFAPYHARFTGENKLHEETITIDVALHHPTHSPYRAFSLPIVGSELLPDTVFGQYSLMATIHNVYSQSLPQVEIVGMLLDKSGRVTGYRVLRLPEGLQVGEKRAIKLNLTSEILDSHLTYRLTASGWNDPASD